MTTQEKEQKKPAKIIKKVLKITGIVLLALIVCYTLFRLISPPVVYGDFYKISAKQVKIPGLLGGFVPQGVTHADEEGITLICGYMPGEENSRIYMCSDSKKNDTRLLKLLYEDGTVYSGHAGGLTLRGNYIYISNAKKIFVVDKETAVKAADGSTVPFIGRFNVPCRASFCSSDDRYLYVGEYYAEGYETDASHRIMSASGEHNAMVFAYEFDDGSEFAIKDTVTPAFCISTTDEVQGFCSDGQGRVYLSCSAALADSHLYEYELSKATLSTFDYEGTSIPMHILDSASLVRDLKVPHMSEDIEIMKDGRMLMAFEAGAKKFGAGILPFSVTNIMAVDVKAR